jgi:hypothetical protein
MATAYYTDLYKSSSQPDGSSPAGVVLAQHTTFTGVTGNHGSGDTFYMVKLPKGGVLLDIEVSAGAGTIVNGATCTGIWKFNLNGGYQGTTAIVQTTLNGTVRKGSYAVDNEVGIYMTFSTAYPAADDVIYFTMLYYMAYGSDMAYDPG